MKRVWCAFIIASAVVALANVLARFSMATPIPFFLLLPGLVVGMCMPDAGRFKTDDPWGPLATVTAYATNLVIHTGAAYALLSLRFWRTRSWLGGKPGDSASR